MLAQVQKAQLGNNLGLVCAEAVGSQFGVDIILSLPRRSEEPESWSRVEGWTSYSRISVFSSDRGVPTLLGAFPLPFSQAPWESVDIVAVVDDFSLEAWCFLFFNWLVSAVELGTDAFLCLETSWEGRVQAEDPAMDPPFLLMAFLDLANDD